MIIIYSILAFALFDYIGYNLIERMIEKGTMYRIIQAIVQVLISAILIYLSYLHFGMNWKVLINAFCFNLLWNSWVCDWIYYGFCFLFGWTGLSLPDEYKTPFKNEVTWAWWTWFSLIFHNGWNNRSRKVTHEELVTESVIGILITLILINTNFFCILN